MKNLFLLCFASATLSLFAQPTAITIDGFFDDWPASLPGVTDVGDVASGIDLQSFQVTNDSEFLYVRLQLNQEIDLVDVLIPHTLYLYIDCDANAGTGFNVAPGFGSELGITFSQRFAYYDVTPATTVDFTDIGFRALPTVTSSEFELAIRRSSIPDGTNPLFPSPTIRLMFRETIGGDRMPNNGTLFTYTFNNSPSPATELIGLEKNNSEHLRLAAWNVNGRFTQTTAEGAMQRILSAVQPDIIGFSEASNVSATYVKNKLDTWLPTGDAAGWRVVKDDFDQITASRYDILQTWPALDRQFPALIDLPGYPQLLFNNAHYSCCAAETNRQNQADEYIAFLLDAKTPGGIIDVPQNTPFVLGGDLNLVGYAQQLNTLIDGNIQNTATYGEGSAPDWDNSNCSVVLTRQTDKRMAYTWRDDNDSYPPGWLDYLIYSDAVLDLQKGFSLQTSVMSQGRLNQYGLLLSDALTASDHFIVVADFSLVQLADGDNDGVPDLNDNCPDIFNPEQADFNGDGTGDLCQDSDADGLLDADELLIFGTNPLLQDSDGDGLTDSAELETTLTNPLEADTNANGISDLDELLTGNTNCPADFDGSQIVDVADLLFFLQFFGSVCD